MLELINYSQIPWLYYSTSEDRDKCISTFSSSRSVHNIIRFTAHALRYNGGGGTCEGGGKMGGKDLTVEEVLWFKKIFLKTFQTLKASVNGERNRKNVFLCEQCSSLPPDSVLVLPHQRTEIKCFHFFFLQVSYNCFYFPVQDKRYNGINWPGKKYWRERSQR